MNPLEKIAETAPVEAKDTNINYSVSKSYEGLVLLEDKAYKGKTSIKYWM